MICRQQVFNSKSIVKKKKKRKYKDYDHISKEVFNRPCRKFTTIQNVVKLEFHFFFLTQITILSLENIVIIIR